MGEDIFTWLINTPSFKGQYASVIKESVTLQFGNVPQEQPTLDWNYLLKCASFLAQSESSFMRDAALRIAQHCLHKASKLQLEQIDSAKFILDVLANRQAIKLAFDKGLLSEQSTLTGNFLGNVNWIKNQVKNSVWLRSGQRLDVNAFQASLWDALDRYQHISISAPTAAGKSYIVKQWIADQIASLKQTVFVYVVPTRALIAEVELDFQREFSDLIKSSRISITPFPFAHLSNEDKPCIYVLTQERFQLLLAQGIGRIDVLVIDEAYKLADGDRGILLQHVIEKAIQKHPTAKVVYISPQAKNPEALVEQTPSSFSRRYEDVTVNQNLIWATQIRGKKWKLDICHPNGNISLGEVSLPANPAPASLKLPMMAVTLGRSGYNIIYVNGAAEAEKTAQQICDLIGVDNQLEEKKINDLIDLCKKAIHREYKLAEVLKYGVAFHYGNIPVLIKEEVETLFKEGLIKFLVCTSTLVEGVNLPCRNIFIRAPKRGNGNPMSPADFWNLAGRAGRWGKDFQGNIVCLDPIVWDAPQEKTLMPIEKATEETLRRPVDLIAFITDEAPRNVAVSQKNLESMASYLAISRITFGSLRHLKWLQSMDPNRLSELEEVVENFISTFQNVPHEIVINHPGISPSAMQVMISYFSSGGEAPEDLMVPFSTDTNAIDKFVITLRRMHGRLTNEFGDNDGYLFRQAIVTVHWMQGRSINQIITERKKAIPTESIHLAIRNVLSDIETVARYKAPKFLSCYNDLLKHFYTMSGRNDLAAEIDDITLFLEMGVNTTTHLSLLNLGLSRTSAVELKAYITADDLSEAQCLEWLTNENNNWQSRELPEIVKREVERMLDIHIT